MENNENEKFNSTENNSILLTSIKNLLFSGIIYFIGYMNWSIIWVILPVVIAVYNDERKKVRLKRRNMIRQAALGNEQNVILENVKDLPAWVYFPDIERAEWVNKIIKQFWPNVNHYAHDLIMNKTEAILKRNLEKYSLKGFTFQRVILGSVPFRIGGVIVYDNVSRDEIVMDLDVSYAGDCDIKFRLRGLNGGIKNFQLYGRLRIVLKPLIKSVPLVGGLQVFFLNNPEIDFDFDGIAGILEIPGINDLLKKSIVDTVSSLMVLPHKFPIKLSSEVSGAQLKTPSAVGVLRVHVIEAKDLLKKDIGFTGKGKSDPYTVLEVGGQICRTETINNTVDPKWDYWCEFIILEFSGQQLNMHVWDQDATDDEFLGRVSLDISNLTKAGSRDLWLNLEEVKHGKIHIRWTWLSLSTDYSHLQSAIYETQQLRLTNMNTALLVIFVDSATDLPQAKISSKPDPYAQIQIGRQIKGTKTVMRTVNPVWEEGFIFFVSNPESDFIDLKIVDDKTANELCSLNYNISNLANKENLEIVQQPFRLENATSESKIVWSLHLKILKSETIEEHTEEFFKERRYSDASRSDKVLPEKLYSDRSVFSSNSTSEECIGSASKSSKSSVISRSNSWRRRSRSSFRSSKDQEFIGKIHLTLRYSIQRQRLIVVVHTLSSVPHRDQVGRNLYVKLYLLPERNKEVKRKTVVKNSNDPTYDESFEYLISQGELNSKKLEVSVIEDKMMKNLILGQVLIDLGKVNIFKTYTDWFELGPHLKKD